MTLYSTSDISDEQITNEILVMNGVYTNVLGVMYNYATPDMQKRMDGMASPCCDSEQLTLLIRSVRILMENYPTNSDKHITLSYATAAILYYYYQLELLEISVSSLLFLKILPRLYNVTPQHVSNIHLLSNFLITSDEPYVSEIRRSILGMNPEPFTGGKKYRKNSSKKTHRYKRSKIRTRHNKHK